MDIQGIVNAIGEAQRGTRSDYHLTLGNLINLLRSAPAHSEVMVSSGGSVSGIQSYRGYYSDLALAPSATPILAGNLLAACEAAIDHTFEGYKGGDFLMGDDTPLWVAKWGDASGLAVIEANEADGTFLLITKQIA